MIKTFPREFRFLLILFKSAFKVGEVSVTIQRALVHSRGLHHAAAVYEASFLSSFKGNRCKLLFTCKLDLGI